MTVIGGANVDIVGSPAADLLAGESNPGAVTVSSGGVGRNIADNLARLGVATRLLSVIGDDPFGERILADCRLAGVDVRGCEVVSSKTSSYLAVLGPDGDLRYGISQMDLLSLLDAKYIEQWAEMIDRSRLVVIDANLEPATIEYLFDRFDHVPFFLDTVSVTKARRLQHLIGHAHTLKPNRSEAEVLSGMTITDRSDLERALRFFLDLGVRRLFISLGSQGMFFGDATTSGRLPSPGLEVVNATGAGDAAMAALAAADVAGMPIAESARFALAASVLTLSHRRTTHPAMSLDAVERVMKEWSS